MRETQFSLVNDHVYSHTHMWQSIDSQNRTKVEGNPIFPSSTTPFTAPPTGGNALTTKTGQRLHETQFSLVNDTFKQAFRRSKGKCFVILHAPPSGRRNIPSHTVCVAGCHWEKQRPALPVKSTKSTAPVRQSGNIYRNPSKIYQNAKGAQYQAI